MGLFGRRERRDDKYDGSAAKTAAEISSQKLADFIRGTDFDNSAGINVTEESALAATAVYACVKVIAESMNTLMPLRVGATS